MNRIGPGSVAERMEHRRRRARPAHDDAVGRHRQPRRRPRRAVCSRDHDHQVGAPGMARGQGGIVAPDFRGRPVGVIEEVEVVDGDHLERPPRRHHQRMRGVGDVDRSGQPFHRRPFQAMPGEVQHADRDPRVDDDGAGDDDPGAARSFHELEKRTRLSPAARACRKRVGQLVHVLADAGALPERRAIIEQDPHARGIVACPLRIRACAATPCESTA